MRKKKKKENHIGMGDVLDTYIGSGGGYNSSVLEKKKLCREDNI